MKIDVITIFPELFSNWASNSLVSQASQKGHLHWAVHDLKEFSGRSDGRVDDRPYGGGPGMVFRPDPILKALESIEGYEKANRYHLSPAGRLWSQAEAETTANQSEHLIFLCSRYEGVDERALQLGGFQDVSIGDYVLMGGEIPAMVIAESIVRLIPGVLGCSQSALEDSFSLKRSGLLDCPHYTRPEKFQEIEVPSVLLSGDHKKIDEWRSGQGMERTLERRPELTNKKGTQ